MQTISPPAEADPRGWDALDRCGRLIIESATNSLVISDPHQSDCPIVYANPAFLHATGYSADEIIGRNCRFLQGPDTDRTTIATMRAAVADERACTVILLNYRKDGSEFWQELTISPVRDDDGVLLYFIGIQADITDLKHAHAAVERAQEDLHHQALHDALTGLPNHTLLQDRLEQALRATRRAGTPVALLLLDLDRFKDINDTFGHHYGDLLLREVGARLRAGLRAVDTVARLGGDEFTVLLPGVGADGAVVAAARITAALERPVVLEGHPFEVGSSIGIALGPDHGDDATTLLRRADVAMYTAKNAAEPSAVYAPGQDQHSPRRLALIGELRQAIAAGQLLLHYQPKMDLAAGRLVGVETLVRWQHPQHGLIPPDQFIPLAEHTGLIKPLTRWVLTTALRQMRAWQDQGLLLRVAVNLSARLLHDPAVVDTIVDALRTAGVEPRWLEIEITESAVMVDPAGALAILTRLHDLGIRLAIDDFGTGYSSLSYLKRLPVDEIKIDKSFVLEMPRNGDDAAIARSIIDLGHNLGLGVVAEGVEDDTTWGQLAMLGCDVAQGYHISRPVPAAELARWVQTAEQQGAAPLTS